MSVVEAKFAYFLYVYKGVGLFISPKGFPFQIGHDACVVFGEVALFMKQYAEYKSVSNDANKK